MQEKKNIEEIEKQIEIKQLACQKWKNCNWFGRLTLKEKLQNHDYYDVGIFDNKGLTIYFKTPYGVYTDYIAFKTKIKRSVYTINLNWDKHLRDIVIAINRHMEILEKEIEELKKGA